MDEEHHEPLTQDQQILYAVGCCFLVCFSGTCSGLTVGLFSLDASRLHVMSRPGAGGSDFQRGSARRLLFFVTNAHWSLVTLLVSNTMAMTALPILLDRLVEAEIALAISVTAVLFFGEVVPQALFVRHSFTVCSYLVPLLWLLVGLTSIISYPASRLLDAIIGHHAKDVVGRDDIEKHVRMAEEVANQDYYNMEGEGGGGDGLLLPEEIQVMRGALSISKRTVRDVRGVAVEDAFMVWASDDITRDLVTRIVDEGYSRVPVYLSNRTHIIGVLLTKTLLTQAYTRSSSSSSSSSSGSGKSSASSPPPKIGELPLRDPFRVQEDTKVSDLLNSFKSGQSHLAAVYNKNGTLVKFVTLDDIFQLLHLSAPSDASSSSSATQQSSVGTLLGSTAANSPSTAGGSGVVTAATPATRQSASVNRSEMGRDALVASAFNAIRSSVAAS